MMENNKETIEQRLAHIKNNFGQSISDMMPFAYPLIITAIKEWHKSELETLRNERDWIPVSERLPKNDEKILFLVHLKHDPTRKQICLGVFLKEDSFQRPNMFCDGGYFPSDCVDGWLPVSTLLPSPPNQ